MEALSLPERIIAVANPKSSTGRIDVFTRLICDGTHEFDKIPNGYKGHLWLEISPRTFPVIVRKGSRLSQMRFRRGDQQILILSLRDYTQKTILFTMERLIYLRA